MALLVIIIINGVTKILGRGLGFNMNCLKKHFHSSGCLHIKPKHDKSRREEQKIARVGVETRAKALMKTKLEIKAQKEVPKVENRKPLLLIRVSK